MPSCTISCIQNSLMSQECSSRSPPPTLMCMSQLRFAGCPLQVQRHTSLAHVIRSYTAASLSASAVGPPQLGGLAQSVMLGHKLCQHTVQASGHCWLANACVDSTSSLQTLRVAQKFAMLQRPDCSYCKTRACVSAAPRTTQLGFARCMQPACPAAWQLAPLTAAFQNFACSEPHKQVSAASSCN